MVAEGLDFCVIVIVANANDGHFAIGNYFDDFGDASSVARRHAVHLVHNHTVSLLKLSVETVGGGSCCTARSTWAGGGLWDPHRKGSVGCERHHVLMQRGLRPHIAGIELQHTEAARASNNVRGRSLANTRRSRYKNRFHEVVILLFLLVARCLRCCLVSKVPLPSHEPCLELLDLAGIADNFFDAIRFVLCGPKLAAFVNSGVAAAAAAAATMDGAATA
jgi:hypothetical protein